MKRYGNGPAAPALLAAAITCVALSWAALAFAQSSERRYYIDIASMSLGQALQEFTKQTGVQHGFLPIDDEDEQLTVGPIKGRITATEALVQLLPDGFTFAWVNPRTVSIMVPPANVPPGGVEDVVAAKDEKHSELSEEQKRMMAFGAGKSGSARGPYDFDWVLVEASKIFDGLAFDVPTTVLDRDDIDTLGVSTVTDLLRYVTQQTYTMSESFLGDGTQFADLRGLGFDTTLVLINGRRTIATAGSLAVNAFDLNSIPLGAVERIEIVSDSTSVMHGADAIGGVLNIVLRDDIPEPRLDIDYGAAAGGAVERHVSFGASGVSSRARGSIVLDYFDRSPLLGRERDRWNNQNFRRFGGVDWRSPFASPGNVRSATPDNLPGLPTTFAAIPPVGAGGALAPVDFVPTAGQQNLESLYRYVSVLAEGKSSAVVAQGEYRISSGTSAFGDVLYVNTERFGELEPPALVAARVPASNPHNPFGIDVLADVLLTDLGPRRFSRRGSMLRGVGGIRGRVEEWIWEASLHKVRNDDTSLHGNRLDPLRVAAALSGTDADGALNPFGANSPDLLASLLAPPSRSEFGTGMIQATAYVRGPVFTVPAGRVDLAVGAERRREDVQYDIALGPRASGTHQRFVTSAFGELRLPLVSDAADIRAVNELSLVLSGRFDDYSDLGDSFNTEYGLSWRPMPSLTVRAALSQSFRPPPLFDLYLPLLDVPLATVDPVRNDLAFPVWRAGGNADLKPSTADSFATGFHFAPSSASDLRIAATYWRIAVDETIKIPAAELLLAAEDVFPERVIRSEPSAADIAAGLPGPLELIDVTRLNHGSIRTSGVDLSASMNIDSRVGRFNPELSATWVHEFTTSDLVEGPDFNRLGVANLQGSVPRWRVVAGLQWRRGGISISAKARYVPSYDDVDSQRLRTGRSVEAQTLVDAQVAFDMEGIVGTESMWRGFEIRAGVFNLLDEEPPFAEAGLLFGFDLSQGDLRQRFGYVKLMKEF